MHHIKGETVKYDHIWWKKVMDIVTVNGTTEMNNNKIEHV